MKPPTQSEVELNNLLEEVSEILKPCVKCGLCKANCPVFKILRKEEVSPRGKAILLSEKTLDKIIFQCNLCGSCEQNCPLNLKICDAIRKAREAMVQDGKELKENKEMIANIRKTGNPFGKEIKDEKLYCC